MDSILDTIKKMLGVDIADDGFDADIIVNINSVLMVLNQLGVGPTTCLSIVDNTTTWDDFLDTTINLDGIKSYIYLKVKMLFDPPSTGFVLDAMNKQITEFEWRLNVQAEIGLYPVIPPVPEDDDI